MFNKKFFVALFFIGFIFLTSMFFSAPETQAATVTCNFYWPQEVVVDGFAHQCGSGKNYCNNEKAQQGIGECCATYGPYANCASAGPGAVEVNTEFPIDAWGYSGWGLCEQQTGNREQLDAYCKSKGYKGIWAGDNACYHEIKGPRWTWNGAIPMVKGNQTIIGDALTKVKCAKVFCTENWSFGAWSSCVNGQRTRTCTDAGDCGTTEYKPVATQGCESLSCATPLPGQEAVIYYKGDGSSMQFLCDSMLNQCRINVNAIVGRCCPINSSDGDCMVVWPVRTLVQTPVEADKKTLTVGESWNVHGGLVLRAESIDAKANPKQTWLTLLKNGVKLADEIVPENKYYLYSAKSFQGYSDFNLFGVYVGSIFAGAVTDMVQFRYAYYNSLWENDIVCVENWSCGGWSSCANSQQTRTCTDANSCGTTANKPSVIQNCTCAENWSCSDWSSCQNGQQTKTCVDLNNCGTNSSKPTTQQACQVQCQESWSCADWSACQNNQQTRTCTEFNNCETINLKPMMTQNCGNICTENWSCNEWSGCLNSKQTKTCVDSNKCGTSKNKPITEQNCVCVEKWTCGNWSSCQNSQQTKICADSNNCGTEKNKSLTKQSCQVQPEPKPPLPPPQPIPPSKPTVSVSPSDQSTNDLVKPVEGEKTEAYVQNTKITIEKKSEGVFTIVSGDTVMTTSLEVVSSSSKPYLKTPQGLKEIKNSPEEIKAKVADKVSVINKIEIKEQNEKLLFYVSGVKKAKLLFIFPVSVKMEFQIDLEKGEIISIKKPWWSFLVKF